MQRWRSEAHMIQVCLEAELRTWAVLENTGVLLHALYRRHHGTPEAMVAKPDGIYVAETRILQYGAKTPRAGDLLLQKPARTEAQGQRR